MSYEEALGAAGATVIDFKEFGSYQGDWWALVRFNGQVGFVTGSYGSCSGCDAFQAEMGYGDERTPEKMRAFGMRYLVDGLTDYDKALKEASRNIEWDHDAEEMVTWVKTHANHFPTPMQPVAHQVPGRRRQVEEALVDDRRPHNPDNRLGCDCLDCHWTARGKTKSKRQLRID